jgi:hypothetical protein
MRPPTDRESLVVGMTLVPGLVSRNRFFALFEDPEVRRARMRSALLRGIVRQLTGAQGHVEGLAIAHGTDDCEVRYQVPSLRMIRRARLTPVELACVRYLVGRAGAAGVVASDDDRAWIDAALRRLAAGLRLAEVERIKPFIDVEPHGRGGRERPPEPA